MKTLLRHFTQLAIVLSLAVYFSSCAQYEIPEGVTVPAFIEVSPVEITAGSGEVHTIWVTVLDRERNPIPNVLVSAKSSAQTRALLQQESLKTNEEGKAVFTVKAVSHWPGTAYITFTADGLSAQVKTIYQHL